MKSAKNTVDYFVLEKREVQRRLNLFDVQNDKKWVPILLQVSTVCFLNKFDPGLVLVSQWRMDDWSLQLTLQLVFICGNIFDYRWLQSDPEFVELVAHLASIELQSILGSENLNFKVKVKKGFSKVT